MSKSTPTSNIQALNLFSFISEFRKESAGLWFLCFYIFIEYIRLYAMYPVLNFLPWGQVAILSCFLSVYMTGNKALGFGAMDKLFVLMSIVIVLSGIFAWNTDASLKWWTTYMSWMIMYFCIVSILTTSNKMILFTLFFILINFKLSQHGARTFAMRGFSFASYGLSGAPGWFHNSGEFALQMVVMFSISMSVLLHLKDKVKKLSHWWILVFLFPGTAALTILGTSSRGGQLAFVVVVVMLFIKKENLIKTSLFIYILAILAMNFLPENQMARFDTMGEDETSENRLIHWAHAMETIEDNPLGIGYRNWIKYYEATYNPDKLEQIHNTVLQAFVELGYFGGGLFIVMLLTALRMNSKTRIELNEIGGDRGRYIAAIAQGVNLGIIGTFIAGIFMSVLYYPMFWLAFALTSALRHLAKKIVLEKENPNMKESKAVFS